MKNAQIRNIRTLSLSEIEQYFEELGEKKFRVKQVWEWLWQKHAMSFADMTNLSKETGRSIFISGFNGQQHTILRRWDCKNRLQNL